jgi:hypothetical protein
LPCPLISEAVSGIEFGESMISFLFKGRKNMKDKTTESIRGQASVMTEGKAGRISSGFMWSSEATGAFRTLLYF